MLDGVRGSVCGHPVALLAHDPFRVLRGYRLSDAERFPAFMRLGTRRTSTHYLLNKLKHLISFWDTIALISSERIAEVARATDIQEDFSSHALPATIESADESNWETIRYKMQNLNRHVKEMLAHGYPEETKKYQVDEPHEELINFALDGICAFALTTKKMMGMGHHIDDLRRPNEATYTKIVDCMRHNLSFVGASGHFKMTATIC